MVFCSATCERKMKEEMDKENAEPRCAHCNMILTKNAVEDISREGVWYCDKDCHDEDVEEGSSSDEEDEDEEYKEGEEVKNCPVCQKDFPHSTHKVSVEGSEDTYFCSKRCLNEFSKEGSSDEEEEEIFCCGHCDAELKGDYLYDSNEDLHFCDKECQEELYEREDLGSPPNKRAKKLEDVLKMVRESIGFHFEDHKKSTEKAAISLTGTMDSRKVLSANKDLYEKIFNSLNTE